jgi:Heparinase II/III-like protein/Heparinase II/III N-terminus
VPTDRKWIRRLKRLTEMGWEEIRVRLQQALTKRWDFTWYKMGFSAVKDDRSNALGGGGRFFFQKEELPGIVSALSKQFPETAQQIVERSERICRHRFDLLGYQGVNYGPEIDWHLDAVHDKRAQLRAWFRVPYLDFHEVGDSKVTWELNRHQHLVTLAKAYRLTEERHYAEELFEQWYHWREQNPYPLGINWASSLEVAFRSVSWLWVWHLLGGCPVMPKQFPADLSHALALNGRHIERFLSTYFSPNTHLLGEGVGLFFIGLLCPGIPSARRWQEGGWNIILREAQRQVRQDGMHFEQSMYYHTYALDFFLHSLILAKLNDIAIPQNLEQTVEKMLEVTRALAAGEHLPRFGDDDGGRLFDPCRNRSKHLLDPLVPAAVLYDRPDFKAGTSHATEELLWLLGTEGLRRFDELPARNPESGSFALEASGTYVMRGTSSYQLVVDAGPQGAGRGGHGHADTLSVEVSANGEPLLIDPGTFTYADARGERDSFRGTAAHNTVQVDGYSQADPAGPFEWTGRANGTAECWIAGKTFDFFVGSHTGYSRLSCPVRHRRWIFHLKSRFWVIRDVLEGTGLHKADLSWHFAPGSLEAIPGGVMFITDEVAPFVLLFTGNRSSSKEISEDWYSPVYGRREPSPTLRMTTSAPVPVEFTTILIPDSEAATRLGVLRPMEAVHQSVPVKAFRYSTAIEDHHLFFAGESRNWHLGKYASDARFLYCSTDCKQTVSQFVICEGSYFAFDGCVLFDANLPVKHSEWSREGSDVSKPFAAATRHEPLPKRDDDAEPSKVSPYLPGKTQSTGNSETLNTKKTTTPA